MITVAQFCADRLPDVLRWIATGFILAASDSPRSTFLPVFHGAYTSVAFNPLFRGASASWQISMLLTTS
jgi:hypothetical protein